MDVTATIVTYHNDLIVLTQTIDSFLNAKLNIKLYVVDNSQQEYIKDLCLQKGVVYMQTEKNIGFAAAHNIIMTKPELLGKYHLILNPDIRFGDGVIESLFDFMEANKNVGNVMPKIIYPDGSTQYLCKMLPTPFDWFWRILIPFQSLKDKISYRFEMRFTNYNQLMNIPYLSGCFMFVRSSLFEEIGVFDEGIFMYNEDTDLSRRIFNKYFNAFYPDVKVIHHFEKGSYKSLRLLIIHIKSTFYYFNKWGWFFDKSRREINQELIRKYKQ